MASRSLGMLVACIASAACVGRSGQGHLLDEADSGGEDLAAGDELDAGDEGVVESGGDAWTTPTWIGSTPTSLGGGGQAAAARDGLVVIGLSGAARGLELFAVDTAGALIAQGNVRTDSGGPAQLSATDTDVLAIELDGRRAYVTEYFGGLLVLDVSDPAAPAFLGSLVLGSENWTVQSMGAYVLLGRHGAGLIVIDVSDPTTPTQVAALPLLGSVQDIHLEGTTAYVAAKSHLHVVDVAVPEAPALLGTFAFTGMAYEIWTAAGRAYVANKIGRTLVVLDVSDPAAITMVHESAVYDMDMRSVDGAPGRLFVGTGSSGVGSILVYDLADPDLPAPLADFPASNVVYELAYDAGFVYGATLSGNLDVVRVGH